MPQPCHRPAHMRTQDLRAAPALTGRIEAGRALDRPELRRNSGLFGACGWRGPAKGQACLATVIDLDVFSGGLKEEHAGATPLWPRNRALWTAG